MLAFPVLAKEWESSEYKQIYKNPLPISLQKQPLR